jgi:hypothetical protein
MIDRRSTDPNRRRSGCRASMKGKTSLLECLPGHFQQYPLLGSICAVFLGEKPLISTQGNQQCLRSNLPRKYRTSRVRSCSGAEARGRIRPA